MTLDKNKSAVIPLEEAIEFTHASQSRNPNATKSFFAGSNKLTRILEQEGCIGIRIYNGYDSEADRTNLVLVGVNESGEDMTDGVIVEKLIPCPHVCPKSSPLIIDIP